MKNVELVVDDLDQVELSVMESPMTTVVTSLIEVFGTLSGRLPHGVQHQVRTLSRRLDLTPLTPLLDRQRRGIPDALIPVTPGRFTLLEEFERICAGSHQIAEEIAKIYPDAVPDYFQPWLEHPTRSVEQYVRALHGYHEVVIRRVYPDLERRLHRESAILQRAIDSGNRRWAMSHLHPMVSLTADRTIRWASPVATRDLRVPTYSVGLVPMICDPKTISSNVFGPTLPPQPNIRFAGPDLAVYAEHARPHGTADPLAALIGPGQARILRRLRHSATTTDLANDLDLAPSTVSQHLRNLLASDTINGHRQGRRVYYRLTDRGHQLLHLYGKPP